MGLPLVCYANQRWFFLVVAFILIIVYAIYHKKVNRGPISLRIGSALLISGAIGNGIDRYVLHGVVDFLILEFGLFLMSQILVYVSVLHASYIIC